MSIVAEKFTNKLTGEPVTNSEMEELVSVIESFIALEQEIANIETLLDQKKTVMQTIQMTQLPELFNNLGLREIELKNGSYVRVRPFYSASLSDEYPELKIRGLAWLRNNEAGSLIKNEVKVPLPIGQDKLAAKVKKFLDKEGIAYGQSETVHHSTLKAFMRERIESGKSFPMEIFRGFAGSKATVEVPK
jgi:hypothetical protein